MAIAHITFPTRDLNRTVAFFEGAMGWQRIDRPGNIGVPAAWLQIVPGQEAHIVQIADFEVSPFPADHVNDLSFEGDPDREAGPPGTSPSVTVADPEVAPQTWLALPDGQEEIVPAFDHVPADALPLVEDEGGSARVLMGTLWGATAATPQHSPTIYADIQLGAGGSIPVDAGADERAVMLVGGEAEVDGQKLDLFALYILRPGHQARLSSATGGRLMLLGGEAFTTRRYVFWNFVSSSRDRINQAKEDWKALRFALIPGDDQEYIPLPEVPKTVSYP